MANTVASARGVFEDKRSKKTGTTGARKLKSAPSHPPTQQMVDTAITTLKERGGSSLLAIKKYITAAYKVDVQKLAPFIKKYLKGAVVTGKLVQTKGNGATGSFKLSASASKELKAKSVYKKKLPKTKSAEAAQKIVKKGVTGGGKVTKISTTTKVKIIKKTATSDIKLKEIATATKKKVEKSKLKNIKETAIVKAEPVKPISVASKRKVPVTKMVSASKPKKAIATKKVNKQ